MSRMFTINGQRVRTWNPIVGCNYLCHYCWARDLAQGRLRHLERYQDGFTPKLVESELSKRFRNGLVFVSSMGDAFGPWVPRPWIEAVLVVVRESPGATFLFLTKNPARYLEFLDIMPRNVILGATIETDSLRPSISRAPTVDSRVCAMASIHGFRKMVSIEPIMEFDHNSFVTLISDISPEFVYLGMDNWKHKLPEPELKKTKLLIFTLESFTEVRKKTIRKAWYEEGK